ncbi:hypothetical protein FOCC_FOCC012459 [Frankliniella occidentalis]|nr:hypothetical protein FOCC_FOCC012459 [Frankliniella occidentalis]
MAERIGAGTPFRLVQDNAPIHTANIVEQWFDANDHVQKLLWPPYSPDLNPIENFFGLIALEWDARFERTVEALEAHAHEVFNSIRRRPQIFRALASSMPRRIQAVIDNNGGSTKY